LISGRSNLREIASEVLEKPVLIRKSKNLLSRNRFLDLVIGSASLWAYSAVLTINRRARRGKVHLRDIVLTITNTALTNGVYELPTRRAREFKCENPLTERRVMDLTELDTESRLAVPTILYVFFNTNIGC
jgi:hypothetical protein